MPNLGDMTPEEKRNYLQFLKDMATQQANEGLQGMVGDAQAMEQEYARNRPDPAAMEAARGTDAAKSHMNMLMAALNAGNGNQGAAQVYGRAAGENPEQDALKNKQGAFMDYLKGLSGLKAQKNALSLPFLQKREAEASEALQGFDQQQSQAQQKAADLAQKAEDKKLSREEREDARRQHAALMRELAGQRMATTRTNAQEKADEAALQKMTKEIGPDPENFYSLIDSVSARIGGLAKPKADLPGVGRLAGRLPNWATGDEGLALRSDLRAVTNALLKLQSGTGVSQSERNEAQNLQGLGDMPESQIYQGLERAKKLAASAIKARLSGFKPEVVNLYKERGGLMPEKVMGVGMEGAQQESSGKVKMRSPDGKLGLVPAAQVEAAKAQGYTVAQ